MSLIRRWQSKFAGSLFTGGTPAEVWDRIDIYGPRNVPPFALINELRAQGLDPKQVASGNYHLVIPPPPKK